MAMQLYLPSSRVVVVVDVLVVGLECVTRWRQDGVKYLLGHRSDVNTSAAAIVCYVRTSSVMSYKTSNSIA